MSHPTEGVLRRLLDEPAGVAAADGDHVRGCDPCTRQLAVITEDAELVHDALATDPGPIDVDAAWERLVASLRSTTDAPRPVRVGRSRRGRLRSTLRRPAIAAVAVTAVVAGAGAAAANDWFEIFRTEQIEAVSISPADLNALPDLEAYGEIELTDEPDVHRVDDAAMAEAETGIDVPEVTELPRGVTGEPTYQVGDVATATFTFSAERAAETAADTGEPLPPTPPDLDGSQVRLQAGPGVAQLWTHEAGPPSLFVGRAVAPRAAATSPGGAAFEVVRDHLLSLPGLSEETARALRTFNADGWTLPLPVPSEAFDTSTATVAGETATVLVTDDRTLAAVVWVDDGIVTVVAGALDEDEVLAVARGLR